MSSNKDKIDCPHSGTFLTVGQGSPGRHRWGHLIVLLDKIADPATRDWYARQCVSASLGAGPATCS